MSEVTHLRATRPGRRRPDRDEPDRIVRIRLEAALEGFFGERFGGPPGYAGLDELISEVSYELRKYLWTDLRPSEDARAGELFYRTERAILPVFRMGLQQAFLGPAVDFAIDHPLAPKTYDWMDSTNAAYTGTKETRHDG